MKKTRHHPSLSTSPEFLYTRSALESCISPQRLSILNLQTRWWVDCNMLPVCGAPEVWLKWEPIVRS